MVEILLYGMEYLPTFEPKNRPNVGKYVIHGHGAYKWNSFRNIVLATEITVVFVLGMWFHVTGYRGDPLVP